MFRYEHGRGKDEKVPKFGVGYGKFEVYLVYSVKYMLKSTGYESNIEERNIKYINIKYKNIKIICLSMVIEDMIGMRSPDLEESKLG